MGHPSMQPLPLNRSLGFRLPSRAGTERRVDRGVCLLQQGTSGGGLFLVRTGVLREATVSPEGAWFVHDLLGPGDIGGSLFPGPALTSIRAVSRAVVVSLDTRGFDLLLQRHPDTAWALIRALQRRIDRAQLRLDELTRFDVGERVLRRLCDLARRHGRPVPGGVRVEVLITQEQLGSMVGATRETTNRALVPLVARGDIRIDARRFVVSRDVLDTVTRA
ncbi:MAG: Crp/Fnr family transcriptional regulator [Actinomycetota bacterium]